MWQSCFYLLFVTSLFLSILASVDAKTFAYVSLDGENRIAAYELNASQGTLTKLFDVAIEAPAGALCVSPDRRFLFASLRSKGKLASFRIGDTMGTLTLINTVEGGDDPAYLATDRSGEFLLTAYYVASKIAVHKIEQGRISIDPIQTIGTADKAHAIMTDRENRFAFVPHTGPNAIFQFHFDSKTGRLTPNRQPLVSTGDGTGPRQPAFHPTCDVVYFDYEQGSAIPAFELGP